MKGLNLKLALTLDKEYTQHTIVEGRVAYTAILFSDILMLAHDLSHEIADRLAVKGFFTKRGILS